MDTKEFEKLRREYMQQGLNEHHLAATPIEQFGAWFNDARKQHLDMPNAMTLATVSPAGTPEARTVLLKSFDETGFVFFTNYDSAKARAIEHQPRVALLFFWSLFDRQIRIEGSIQKLDEQASQAYFDTRPLDSQISAIISHQSERVESREFLQTAFQQKKQKIEQGEALEKPANWGGYHITPDYFEFWQGRENRLHDRLVYKKNNSRWDIYRLAP